MVRLREIKVPSTEEATRFAAGAAVRLFELALVPVLLAHDVEEHFRSVGNAY